MDTHEEYWKIAEVEQRFNAIQSTVRALASTWMLAAFGATAVLVRSEAEVTWLLHKQMLVVIVSTMASVGLFTLWIVDQVVYQRLLNAAFMVGLKMEHDNKALPPMRALMMDAAEGIGMSRWLRLFYLLPMLGFLLISGWLSFVSETDLVGGTDAITPIIGNPTPSMIVLTIAQSILIVTLLTKAKDVYAGGAADLFHDDRFSRLFEGGGFRADLVAQGYKARDADQSGAATGAGTHPP